MEPSPQMDMLEDVDPNIQFSKDPTTLIYNKPELGHVERLGADKRWHGTPALRPFANLTFKYHGQPKYVSRHPQTLFSDAPLEGVVRAAVYRRKLVTLLATQKYYCTGILFTYENGGQRAVGECRVKVDECEVYEKPVEMVFSRFPVGLKDWHPDQKSAPGGGQVDCVYVEFRT